MRDLAVHWLGRCPLARSKGAQIARLEYCTPEKVATLDARVTAINDGLYDPSQRFSTELVVSLAYGEPSRLPSPCSGFGQ